jgi:hypothetical protein
MGIKELQCGSIKGRSEEAPFSVLSFSRRFMKGPRIKIEVMYRRRPQMSHTNSFRTPSPAFKQSRSRIDDSKSFRGDIRFAQKADGEVHTMNSAANDQPVD